MRNRTTKKLTILTIVSKIASAVDARELDPDVTNLRFDKSVSVINHSAKKLTFLTLVSYVASAVDAPTLDAGDISLSCDKSYVFSSETLQ